MTEPSKDECIAWLETQRGTTSYRIANAILAHLRREDGRDAQKPTGVAAMDVAKAEFLKLGLRHWDAFWIGWCVSAGHCAAPSDVPKDAGGMKCETCHDTRTVIPPSHVAGGSYSQPCPSCQPAPQPEREICISAGCRSTAMKNGALCETHYELLPAPLKGEPIKPQSADVGIKGRKERCPHGIHELNHCERCD